MRYCYGMFCRSICMLVLSLCLAFLTSAATCSLVSQQPFLVTCTLSSEADSAASLLCSCLLSLQTVMTLTHSSLPLVCWFCWVYRAFVVKCLCSAVRAWLLLNRSSLFGWFGLTTIVLVTFKALIRSLLGEVSAHCIYTYTSRVNWICMRPDGGCSTLSVIQLDANTAQLAQVHHFLLLSNSKKAKNTNVEIITKTWGDQYQTITAGLYSGARMTYVQPYIHNTRKCRASSLSRRLQSLSSRSILAIPIGSISLLSCNRYWVL